MTMLSSYYIYILLYILLHYTVIHKGILHSSIPIVIISVMRIAVIVEIFVFSSVDDDNIVRVLIRGRVDYYSRTSGGFFSHDDILRIDHSFWFVFYAQCCRKH